MAERRFLSPPVSGQAVVNTDNCPRVAELIEYALGTLNHGDRQRIETHLHNGGCGHCGSWIEQAKRFRTEPAPAAEAVNLARLISLPPAPPPPLDQTPIPPSARFQKQAFCELERRLRLIEES